MGLASPSSDGLSEPKPSLLEAPILEQPAPLPVPCLRGTGSPERYLLGLGKTWPASASAWCQQMP